MAAVYGNAIKDMINGAVGAVDWDTDTIAAALMKNTYTVGKEETSMSTAATHKATGTTDKTLTTSAAAAAAGTITADSADPATWSAVSSGQTLDAVIVYKEAGADTADIPIAYCDFTGIAANGGDITVSFSASGVFTITY